MVSKFMVRSSVVTGHASRGQSGFHPSVTGADMTITS